MTDTSPVAITHPTTEPYPVTVPSNSPALNGAVSDSAAADEEEPYTIKCICAFEDDDGNTVFCERCETWQHIECYYQDHTVPDVHNCVDCEPRPVDGRRATERQRRIREQSDGGDRKAKRPGAKTQKKKIKDNGDQVNGFHYRSESGARNQPPVKKSKTNHRASGSVGSLSGVPSFPPDRKRGASSMSPTKSSGPSIPLYSNEFAHLYDRDEEHSNMDSNLFVNLPLAADLASWVTNPEALAQATNGRTAQDTFTWSDTAVDRSHWPNLSVESITDPNIDVDGQHPMWKILKTQDHVGKNEIVGEITGKIGLLRDYCLDEGNRWQELRHPEPFVFFHPLLPIYIDSRHEGSRLRYVRRSCRPNVTMKTYITNEVEYHFCFVAKEDIPADSEITAMWYLDPQLFESNNGVVKQETSENAQDAAAISISNVLSHFGGCACVPPPSCLLSSVDRRRHPKDSKSINTKRKKPKSKSNISPPGSNSRAGSEVTKNMDEDDQADSRSPSGSGPRSRDLTPTSQNPHDAFGLAESELSAREKRKIAAAEKKFQQLEQDQQSTHKRRKRASGQSTQTTPTIGSSAQFGYFTHQGGRDRQSPPLAMSPGPFSGARHGSPRKTSGGQWRSPLGRQYVNTATQTESDMVEGTATSPLPSPRRANFVPLTQRLLKRCYADRVRLEQVSQRPKSPSQPNPESQMLSPTSSSPRDRLPSTAKTPSASGDKEDVEMKDSGSPTVFSPAHSLERESDLSPLSGKGSSKPPMPPPWPSTAAHNTRIPGMNMKNFQSNLRVPLPPPVFAAPSGTSPSSATPSATSPSTMEPSHNTPTTPGGGVTAPSPVKKKLSLGDYLIRRNTMASPATEKSQAQATSMLPPKSPPATRDAPNEHEAPRPESSDSADVMMKDAPGSNHASNLHSIT